MNAAPVVPEEELNVKVADDEEEIEVLDDATRTVLLSRIIRKTRLYESGTASALKFSCIYRPRYPERLQTARSKGVNSKLEAANTASGLNGRHP